MAGIAERANDAAPVVPDLPTILPEIPDLPDMPDLPQIQDMPDIPVLVVERDAPVDLPDVPEIPDIPEFPVEPDFPADLPDLPDVPGVPEIPDLPDFPDEPDSPGDKAQVPALPITDDEPDPAPTSAPASDNADLTPDIDLDAILIDEASSPGIGSSVQGPLKEGQHGSALGGSYSFRSNDLGHGREEVFTEARPTRRKTDAADENDISEERRNSGRAGHFPPLEFDESLPVDGLSEDSVRIIRRASSARPRKTPGSTNVETPFGSATKDDEGSGLGAFEDLDLPEMFDDDRSGKQNVVPKPEDLNLSFDDLEPLGPVGKFSHDRPAASGDDEGLDLDVALREDSFSGVSGPSQDPVPSRESYRSDSPFRDSPFQTDSSPGETSGMDDWGGGVPLGAGKPSQEFGAFGEDLFDSGGGLELDLSGHDVVAVPTPGGAAPPPAQAPRPAAVKGRRIARAGGGGAGAGRVALLVLLLAGLVGAILGQTSYGYFGINLITSENAGSGRGSKRSAGAADIVATDTRSSYEDEVRRLETALKSDPDSERDQAALYQVLLRYRERFPVSLAAEPRLVGRLRELQTKVTLVGPSAEKARILEMLAQGQYAEAAAALDMIIMATSEDWEVFHLRGKAALGAGDLPAARKALESALALNKEGIATRLFLARVLKNMNEVQRSRKLLGEILALSPKHLGATVALAELAYLDKNLDEAARLASEVVAIGRAGVDSADLFDAHRVLAWVEDARGSVEGKMRELRAAMAVLPDREETAIVLGRMLLKHGKRGEALAVLEPCRARGCSSEEFLLVYAEAAFEDDRADVAEAVIAEGGAKHPDSPRFQNLKGLRALRADRLLAAVEAFQESVRIDPSFTEGHLNLVNVLAKERKLNDAVAALDAGLKTAAEPINLLILLADLRIQQRDVAAAEATLRRAIAMDPKSTVAQERLGLVLISMGRMEEASKVLATLEEKRVLGRDGALGLATAYLDRREPAKARDVLERLQAIRKNDPLVQSEYGRALGESGQREKAAEVLDQVITNEPSFGLAHFYRGLLLVKQGEIEEGIDRLQTAVRLDGGNTRLRLELARALVSQKEFDATREAKVQLDTVISAYQRGDVPREQRDPDAWVMRGKIMFVEQKYAAAMKDFEAALGEAPSRLDVMNDFGKTLYEMARYGEAIPYFRQVLARDSSHGEGNYYLGRMMLRQGNTRAAKDHLERSVQRDRRLFPEAHRLLGMIYRDERLNSLARKSFETYLELEKDNKAAIEEVRQLLARMR
jgi:tetratricopeptide (TPR) repeat protein